MEGSDSSDERTRTEPPQLVFGHIPFASDERDRIQRSLNMKLSEEFISYRPGAGGSEVAYIQQWMLFDIANNTFGFNGWSTAIKDVAVDYADKRGSKYEVGVCATVRVSLKDGSFHEDIGYGNSSMPTRHQAMEKAKKQAVTDATKRALKMFGQVFGQCLNDKDYQKFIKPRAKQRARQPKADMEHSLMQASQLMSNTPMAAPQTPTQATQPPTSTYARRTHIPPTPSRTPVRPSTDSAVRDCATPAAIKAQSPTRTSKTAAVKVSPARVTATAQVIATAVNGTKAAAVVEEEEDLFDHDGKLETTRVCQPRC
eukprot:m.104534 g.104534  ORF g.104534 m.104534 type:complete len:313 (-) comp13260_c0_seq15:437-1375(-)